MSGIGAEELLQLALSLCLGLGLSAACGFRIFLPMLGMSVASKLDFMHLSNGFEWIESWPALAVFAVATVVEIGAYFFPWVDNAVDSVATPAATIAGIVVVAAVMIDLPPLMKWSLAAIAGGGSAGLIKGGMGLVRAGSSVTTGGVANPVVSFFELVTAFVMTLLALIVPVLAAIAALVMVVVVLRVGLAAYRRVAKRKASGELAVETVEGSAVPPKVR